MSMDVKKELIENFFRMEKYTHLDKTFETGRKYGVNFKETMKKSSWLTP